MYRKEHILSRHPANPIIKPSDIDWMDVDAVFNCGQTMFEDKTILLLSICPRGGEPALHIGKSENGVDFKINPEPFIKRTDNREWHDFDNWVIDPRVTRIDDGYYIIRPMNSKVGPFGFLQKTTDWMTYESIGCVSLPCNRVPCLFPEKIDGLYYRLDRPYNFKTGEIWLSASPDLIFWGKHRLLLDVPYSPVWATEKIGPTPPIKTDAGWLVIIHGVITYAGGGRYSLGAVMLDLEEPWRVIGHSKGWILTPDEPYEFMGNCQNTIFSCGAIADPEKDLIRVYYGAADTCIGLATGALSELINDCFTE
jgi:predicted GH43/DUF377 family glycosyl hydrolase